MVDALAGCTVLNGSELIVSTIFFKPQGYVVVLVRCNWLLKP